MAWPITVANVDVDIEALVSCEVRMRGSMSKFDAMDDQARVKKCQHSVSWENCGEDV
jgi:hypothetical protein